MRIGGPGWLPLAALVLVWGVARAAPPVADAELKAAFVYNFASFTSWPGSAGAVPAALAICVASRVDPQVDLALRRLDGKTTQGRVVRVVAQGAMPEVGDCHVLVLGVDGLGADPTLRAAIAGKSVLTIVDGAPVPGHGEMVRLVRDGSRLRFEIDRKVAEAAGLSISSKLLRLARRVR